MFIAKLHFPGAQIVLEPRETAGHAQRILIAASSALAEACMSYTWYAQRMARILRWLPDAKAHADPQLYAEPGYRFHIDYYDGDLAAIDELRQTAEAALDGSAWTDWPQEYDNLAPHLYAKVYLAALDRISRLIGALKELPGAPSVTGEAHTQMLDAFPDLKDVRDTGAHMDERIRGKTRGKKVDLQPVRARGIQARGGILLVEAILSNHIASTLFNGRLGEVELSQAALYVAQASIQACIDAFEWRGPERYWPSLPRG